MISSRQDLHNIYEIDRMDAHKPEAFVFAFRDLHLRVQMCLCTLPAEATIRKTNLSPRVQKWKIGGNPSCKSQTCFALVATKSNYCDRRTSNFLLRNSPHFDLVCFTGIIFRIYFTSPLFFSPVNLKQWTNNDSVG